MAIVDPTVILQSLQATHKQEIFKIGQETTKPPIIFRKLPDDCKLPVSREAQDCSVRLTSAPEKLEGATVMELLVKFKEEKM